MHFQLSTQDLSSLSFSLVFKGHSEVLYKALPIYSAGKLNLSQKGGVILLASDRADYKTRIFLVPAVLSSSSHSFLSSPEAVPLGMKYYPRAYYKCCTNTICLVLQRCFPVLYTGYFLQSGIYFFSWKVRCIKPGKGNTQH